MNKGDVLDLIRYHVNEDDARFRCTAHDLAEQLNDAGDTPLALYILGLLGDTPIFSQEKLNSKVVY